MKRGGLVLLTLLIAGGLVVGCGKKKKEGGDKKQAPTPMAAAMGPERPAPKPRVRPRPRRRVDPGVPEAVISVIAGNVEVRRSGQLEFRDAHKGEKLFALDAIRAGADGEATLAFWDNSSLEVTPESALTINNSASVSDPAPSVTVMAGAARFEIEKRTEGQGAFAVYTPSAMVAVMGTTLAVGVGLSGDARVAVEEGEVQITPVVKVDTQPTAITAGKVVVIPVGKPADKPADYKATEPGWDEWLEGEGVKVVKNADAVAEAHAAAVEAAEGEEDTLDGAETAAVTASTGAETEAEKAAKAKDEAAWKAAQDKVEGGLETVTAVDEQRRLVRAKIASRAYLLGLLHARVAAGVYKVDDARKKAITAKLERVAAKIAKRRLKHQRRKAKHRQRLKRLRRAYLRHHRRGRALARSLKQPPPFATLKLKRRAKARKIAIAGWTKPLWKRPRIKAKRRKAAFHRRQARWFAHKAWKARRKARSDDKAAVARRQVWKAKHIAKRRARWAKRPKTRDVYRRRWQRHRRLRGLGPRGHGMGPMVRFKGRPMGPGMGLMPPQLRGMGHGMRVPLTPMQRELLKKEIRRRLKERGLGRGMRGAMGRRIRGGMGRRIRGGMGRGMRR